MATPSNMPAYAQSNAAASAAAKAEAAKLAAVKKATPVPTPTPVIKPASAPAPSATVKPAVLQNVSIPPKANVPPIPTPQPTPSLVAQATQKPAGMPAYAISNEAATKNSLANTYDTVAADAKAKNDALAKAFKETVAPQTDSIIRSVASNPIETDEQKRARLLKDGSVAIRARSMTPEQQKATWGIVIDFSGGQQIASQTSQQAKPDTSFLTPNFQQYQQAVQNTQPTPLNVSAQTVQGPPIPIQPTSATPSNIIPSGAVLGEAAKSQSNTAKAFIDKLATQTYGTPSKDVFATSGVEKPVMQEQAQQQQQQTEKKVEQPVVEKKVIPQNENVVSYQPPTVEKKIETPITGYTPQAGNIVASDIAAEKIAADRLAEQKRLADEEAAKASMLKQLMVTPVESTNVDGTTRTPEQAAQELATRQKAQELLTNKVGSISENLQLGQGPITSEKVQELAGIAPPTEFQYYGGYQPSKFTLDKMEQPAVQPEQQTTMTEDAFRKLAEKQVDENIKKQTADLDLQIKQATENRDFNTAQQLQAYKDAIRNVQNQAFLSGQGITQGMANRGLLSSGMYADALLRAGMGTQQQLGQLARTQQSNIEKATLDFNQLQEKINKQRNDILSGRTADIDKATKQLQADQAAADKAKADIIKQKVDQQNTEWNSFQTALLDAAKANDQDIRQLVPVLASRDKQKVLDFLASSGNMPLTVAGQQAIMDLNYKGTQGDKLLQDMYGVEYSNGQPIKDKNGNYIKTLDAISKETDMAQKDRDYALRVRQQNDLNRYREQQLKIQQQNANTSSRNATTSAGKSKKAEAIKLPSDAQQRKTIENIISPLLTNVYTDSNGRQTTDVPAVNLMGTTPKPTTQWLLPENEKSFNDKMKSLYEQGLIGDKMVIETYMQRNKVAPNWLPKTYNETDLTNMYNSTPNPIK